VHPASSSENPGNACEIEILLLIKKIPRDAKYNRRPGDLKTYFLRRGFFDAGWKIICK